MVPSTNPDQPSAHGAAGAIWSAAGPSFDRWREPAGHNARPAVHLRAFAPGDFDRVFSHLGDPVASRMAGLTLQDPLDRAAFDAAWEAEQANPDLCLRAIWVDGHFAGHVVRNRVRGKHTLGYWLERQRWGRGVATEAVRLLLAETPCRPLFAHVAEDNPGSLRVLQKCGFTLWGQTTAYAWGRSENVRVDVLVLN